MTEKTTAAAQRRQYTLNIVILVAVHPLAAESHGGDSHEADGGEIADKHQSQECPGLAVRAGEFLPDEHTPQGGDHGRRLTDGVGDGHADESGGHKIRAASAAPQDAS